MRLTLDASAGKRRGDARSAAGSGATHEHVRGEERQRGGAREARISNGVRAHVDWTQAIGHVHDTRRRTARQSISRARVQRKRSQTFCHLPLMRATRARCDHTRTSASSYERSALSLRPCARAFSSVVDPPSAPSPPACCFLLGGRVRRPRPPLVFRNPSLLCYAEALKRDSRPFAPASPVCCVCCECDSCRPAAELPCVPVTAHRAATSEGHAYTRSTATHPDANQASGGADNSNNRTGIHRGAHAVS